MEKKILKRKDIKIIFSKESENPKNLLFLFTKGWAQRAGIIPYVYKNGKYYLLLGRNIGTGQLTDFGGGCERLETPIQCAVREFREETRETLNFDHDKISHVIVTERKRNRPHQVILLIRFNKMGNEEQNFEESLKIHIEDECMNELSMMKWILKDNIFTSYPANELENSLKNLLEYLLF